MATRDKDDASTEALDARLAETVCRRQDLLGTRLGDRRVLKTRTQWNAEAEVARTQLRRIDEQSAHSARH